jgi:hypothetical protein
MPTTRTSPLRARPSERSLDGHPLATVADNGGPATLTAPARPVPGPSPASARGSLQSLDWRQAVGGALVALGMLAIVIAWFGVSGTLDPGEQMPYISSGGFGGSALIAVGVTLLISFEHSRDRDALAQVLAELDELRQRLEPGTALASGQDAAPPRT